MDKLSRRGFIKSIAGVGVGIFISGCSNGSDEISSEKSEKPASRDPKFDTQKIAVAKDKTPAENTRNAIEALGGMDKLVKKDDFVLIKPNMAWSQPASVAATTNPDVVAELVKMCIAAGAGKVLVVDHVLDKPAEAVMTITGIRPAAEAAGAVVQAAQNESMYRGIDIPNGKVLTNDTCLKEILSADVFINVPVAKHHSATSLTLGMKNLMGCNWNPQAWHQSLSLHQCIADYLTAIKPDLTVIDANRIMLTNGPKGPGNTEDPKHVLAGVDPVALDAYAATFFNLKPSDVQHIKLAHEAGVGEMNIEKMEIVAV